MSKLGNTTTDDDEVEQLLRAAQDDMLLKLSLNSHMARASSAAAIDPDLDRRFQALKKPQKLKKHDDSVKKPPKEAVAGGSKSTGKPDDDDLIARFAALKNVLPSNSSNSPMDGSVDRPGPNEEEEEEDEVEKVIKWAIDAARLDPSPLSDDDDHHHNDESDYSSDDDDGDDDDGVGKGKKSKRK